MGHMGIIQLIINHGFNNWNYCYQQACMGGQLKIIKFMIQKGAANGSKSRNDGLTRACCGGHVDIINMMIEKGVDRDIFIIGFLNACQYGHLNIVKMMLKLIKKTKIKMIHTYRSEWSGDIKTNNFWINGFIQAASVEIIKKSKENNVYFGTISYGTVQDYLKIVQLIIENGSINSSGVFDDAFGSACGSGCIEMVKLLLNRVDTKGINYGFTSACEEGHLHIYLYLINKFNLLNIDEGFIHACLRGQLKIVKLLAKQCGLENVMPWVIAKQCNNDETTQWLIQENKRRILKNRIIPMETN